MSRKIMFKVFFISLFLILSTLLFAAEWAVGNNYSIGDIVTYQGGVYECLSAHTSFDGWEPPYLPALWNAINTQPTPTPTITPRPSPTRSPCGRCQTATPTPQPTKSPCGRCQTPTPIPAAFLNACFIATNDIEFIYPITDYTITLFGSNLYNANKYLWKIAASKPWISFDYPNGEINVHESNTATVNVTVNWGLVDPQDYNYKHVLYLEGESDLGNYVFDNQALFTITNPDYPPMPTPMCTPSVKTLEGRITEIGTGYPLKNTELVIADLDFDDTSSIDFDIIVTYTDENGYYKVDTRPNCKMKKYRVLVNNLRYKELLTEDTTFHPAAQLNIEVELKAGIIKNVAAGKPIYASSMYASEYPAKMANDKDVNSVWGSAITSKPEWIYVNLYQKYQVREIKINWFDPYYASDYSIYASNDAQNWTLVKTVTGGTGGINVHTGNIDTRYIGLYMTGKANPYAYGIRELEVLGL